MKRTTIKDVAKRAGVSITTVSHALSGGGVVKQETRDRIRELAREMNYMPSWSGRNLKAEETGVIGLYVSYIRGFYGQLADAIYDVCREAGYELNIVIAAEGSAVLDNLLSHRVDGAVILHHGFADADAHVLRNSELPTVFLDRELSGPNVSSVLFDSYGTGYMAAEYLYSLGHRKMMLAEGQNTYDGIERSRGFQAFLEEKGLTLEPEYTIYGGFDRHEAKRSMNRFLESGLALPTALFAANDDSAIGCMQALSAAGYSVPGDVSVMGCDNVELSKWYVPSLTTLDTGIACQGVTAARELVKLLRSGEQGSLTKIPSTLVERNSCVRVEEENL